MANVAIDKRQQLIDAAAGLFHRHGVADTTLADIARDAGIALGSVFYHFRTKDDLVAAVAERRCNVIAGITAGRDGLHAPYERLVSLIEVWISDREADARYGCPIGSFCFELARARGPLSDKAVEPFRALLDWCTTQFQAMGVTEGADRHALHLVASLQGISLTAAVFGDPDMILHEAGHLREWLGEVHLRHARSLGKPS